MNYDGIRFTIRNEIIIYRISLLKHESSRYIITLDYKGNYDNSKHGANWSEERITTVLKEGHWQITSHDPLIKSLLEVLNK